MDMDKDYWLLEEGGIIPFLEGSSVGEEGAWAARCASCSMRTPAPGKAPSFWRMTSKGLPPREATVASAEALTASLISSS